MMAIYVSQRKENFIRNLDTKTVQKCGVSILTNQKVMLVLQQVLNYFGIHSSRLLNGPGYSSNIHQVDSPWVESGDNSNRISSNTQVKFHSSFKLTHNVPNTISTGPGHWHLILFMEYIHVTVPPPLSKFLAQT